MHGAMAEPTRTVELVAWTGPWPDDDPDANFKADVALYAHVDPMATIGNLASALHIPEGAVVRYVLAKWASAGSGGLLELGPTMVHRLLAPVQARARRRPGPRGTHTGRPRSPC